MSEKSPFEGNMSNGSYPEASPEQKEKEATYEKALIDVIGSQIDADANEAEKIKREDPSLSVYPESKIQESVNIARSQAMNDRALKIATSLFGGAVSRMNTTDDEKKFVLQSTAAEIVSTHLAAKRAAAGDTNAAKFL